MRDNIGSNRKVAQVIDVLDCIAFQSSLLALNAAVSAGDSPVIDSEFVQVACQVRDLAVQGALAAQALPLDEQERFS